MFEKNNLDTCHVVLDCYVTPNTKFHFDLMLFHLTQDLRRPEKILLVTIKKKKNSFTFYFTLNTIVFLVDLKAKTEKKLKLFSIDQNLFCLFWGPRIKLKKLIFRKFPFWHLLFEEKGSYLQIYFYF